ncbi:MAG: bifunctional phosphoribosylaminoimidazolecarboxamide formyltransferase/IMP cyclohydrolase, partial [bacterium]|nr:bifunctional phosphoribosylaminoimidazolecarboxamide formyltransferase/IMP cyclohydrolase [bacterium]
MTIENIKIENKEIENTQRYALLSVSDKTDIINFARVLDGLGYRIISTGGTGRELEYGGVTVLPIQEITGNPECFDGRMKTISFQAEGGILFDRKKPSHLEQARQFNIPAIDIVICNLYPFEKTVAKPDATLEEAIENIDVGGPTMVRAAAKNHKNVLVVVDPADYARVTFALQKGEVTGQLRQELAAKAFGHLAFYDAQIARYLSKEAFPDELTLPLRRNRELRYGDNPDQQAVLYFSPDSKSPLARLQKLTGRELSATNVTDIEAGINSVRLFDTPAAVVIKHNTPCGIALGPTPRAALARALEADPESAFGGVVVMNRPMDFEAAKVVAEFKEAGRGQMDIIAGPGIEGGALELLQQVRKSTGVYTFGDISTHPYGYTHARAIDGGMVLQTENNPRGSFINWQVVTKKQPTSHQLEQMKVAWQFIARIRSNTVAVIDAKLPM